MYYQEIKNSENTCIAKIYSFLDHSHKTSESLINDLNNQIKLSEIGFAGFAKKEYLPNFLKSYIFQGENIKNLEELNLKTNQVIQIIEETFLICNKYIQNSKPTHIYIFPSYSKFTQEKLSGVSGFCPYTNVIHLFVNNNFENQELKNTLAHEYNHSLIKHNWHNLLDSLIYEGLAQNFEEQITRKAAPSYATKVNLEDCHKYFKVLKKDLQNKDLHNSVFFDFNEKKYPFWLGYSLGYQIVKSYIEKHPEKTWTEIIETPPQQILNNSSFNKTH